MKGKYASRIPYLLVLFLLGGILETRAQSGWEPMFDGKSLAGWKKTSFGGGEGSVEARDGQLLLGLGSYMTGVTWTRDFPKGNFEVQLEAMRVEGSDFFCGLTFPVKDSYCSLIVGGWGGTIVGLSSINGMDASENETTRTMLFKDKTWYRIRVQVTAESVKAWIDDQNVVEVETGDRRFSTRLEVDNCQPFGLATWRTGAAIRRILLRRLPQ